ncbi:wings apart-like protein 2 isoform X1 [Typha angustifolia]|uniref:wings apart-like protein 2 isoform X1 n=1 Tax=Typha angustifolia TaxID=59011 RepID=UPI003C2EAB97
MIVRTYTRRTRGPPGSNSLSAIDLDPGDESPQDGDFSFTFSHSEDTAAQELPPNLPQFGAFSSSQDSSSWSLDPDLLLPPPPIPDDLLLLPSSADAPRKLSRKAKGSSFPKKDGEGKVGAAATATLMEAQEFGEMMEHVDEVNFALDGLRPGQPARIRRASLLSLLSVCETPQRRRLLRAQGMAKRIIDAILDLKFDDDPTSIAAAAIFYVLASDVQDDHLLDSPSCIRFLLKLLNPSTSKNVEEKAPSIGCNLLGIRRANILNDTNKGTDSSSREIVSKVQEILLSCKEIKSTNGADEEIGRPELNSKWIALLTIEKACLSTVSFEDTSEMVRRIGGDFKERLREFGGLDAIFDVLASCYSALEELRKARTPTALESKDGVAMRSVVLLLKCLKIMENATFLSNENQNYLLRMTRKLDSKGLALSFVGVVVGTIKILSVLSLLQRSSDISNTEEPKYSGAHINKSWKQNEETSSSGFAGCSGVDKDSKMNKFSRCQKQDKMSVYQSEISLSNSEMTVSSGSDVCLMRRKLDCSSSVSCNGASSGLFRDSFSNGGGPKMKLNLNSAKVNAIRNSTGWIPMKANGSEKRSGSLAKRPRLSEEAKGDCKIDCFDPFAFDEGDQEPSKWEMLAMKKETSQKHQRTETKKEFLDLQEVTTVDHVSSLLTNGENHQSCESSLPSVHEEDTNLLEDCLLTSVKVLMNLTNDNPVGCQEIAACGGLDTMASLITRHFPSFDLCFPVNSHSSKNMLPDQNVSAGQDVTSDASHVSNRHLRDHELDFLVAILGLLVNLVEKDSRNRVRLASTRVSVDLPGNLESKEVKKDVIPLLCSVFLANQGAGKVDEEGKAVLSDDEDSLLQGQREAEMMIVQAYAALLLAFLSTESSLVREAIASCLPDNNLQILVPVLERFVAFHLTLNMISPETHSSVIKVIESCKGP